MRQVTTKRDLFFVAILFCAAILSTWFAWFCIMRHYRLESRDFDLGVLSNVIINTSRGELFRSSYYEGNSFLGVHVVPLYLLLALFYRIYPHIESLLLFQSIAVCFAAIPLYAIARRCQFAPLYAFILSWMYLLHPANHGALFYDFHELAFFPLMFFLYIYALLSERRSLVWSALFLCCIVKEDIALIVLASFPLIIQLLQRQGVSISRRTILMSIFILIIWYIGTVFIREWAGGVGHPFWWYYKDLIPEGSSGVIGIVKGIFSNPGYFIESRFTAARLLYGVQIAGPLLFASFFSLYGILALLPGFTLTLLSSDQKWELFSISFQYVWYLLPPLFIGFIFVCNKLSARYARYLIATAACSTLIFSWRYGAVLDHDHFVGGYREVAFQITPEQEELRKEIYTSQFEIPEDDWIVCSGDLCAQLSERINVLPCRVWFHEKHTMIRWALVTDDKNCSEHSLKKYGFEVVRVMGPARLWRKDCQAHSCLQ